AQDTAAENAPATRRHAPRVPPRETRPPRSTALPPPRDGRSIPRETVRSLRPTVRRADSRTDGALRQIRPPASLPAAAPTPLPVTRSEAKGREEETRSGSAGGRRIDDGAQAGGD